MSRKPRKSRPDRSQHATSGKESTDAPASDGGSQNVSDSHSELRFSDLAGRDVVVSFDGGPDPFDDSGSEVVEADDEISFDQYFQAIRTGWVLYLENSTDLAILQAFARKLGHKRAIRALERPLVEYVQNQPATAQRHFHGLREANTEIRGIALFDRLELELPDIAPIECLTWRRREIENYVCSRATLEAYAAGTAKDDSAGLLFAASEVGMRRNAMREAIAEVESALKASGKPSPWCEDIKASEDFLDPVFASYFRKLNLPNPMANRNFHELAEHVPETEIDPEICAKLDAIADVAEIATPGG
ncbi:MAG: hypothetical protein OXU79_11425 [Gemmatimonadota bacterium]|nr:hypothetical protein [Gemmatimonadota bacterium]